MIVFNLDKEAVGSGFLIKIKTGLGYSNQAVFLKEN